MLEYEALTEERAMKTTLYNRLFQLSFTKKIKLFSNVLHFGTIFQYNQATHV